MSADALLSEVEVGGDRLALYPGRVVHQGGAVTEIVPLAQLASVRIAFEREPGKLGGAIALTVVGALLWLVAQPTQAWLTATSAKIVEPGRRESLDAMLHSVFSALLSVAGVLPAAAATMLAAAALLAALWIYGRTTLTLCFAATERAFSVRGSNAALLEFAEALGERLSAMTKSGGG